MNFGTDIIVGFYLIYIMIVYKNDILYKLRIQRYIYISTNHNPFL
jgi:hypothetical protein